MTKSTPFTENVLLNCKGKLTDLSVPVVMGILNMTEDSFYAGSRLRTEDQILEKAGQMLTEGALILDIGGQSTRPASIRISPGQEIQRTVPAIKSILARFPGTLISIDTYSAEVARAATDAGAVMINDISAGVLDPEMIPLAGRLKLPYVAMHMQGDPATMQKDPKYEDLVTEILDFFIRKAEECRGAGINDLIIDPGFGFGKNPAHNYTLLSHLDSFALLGKPILVGISRKSMVYRLSGTNAEQALNGTTALHMLALEKGARILRVHDVKEALEVIGLYQFYLEQH